MNKVVDRRRRGVCVSYLFLVVKSFFFMYPVGMQSLLEVAGGVIVAKSAHLGRLLTDVCVAVPVEVFILVWQYGCVRSR